MPHALRIVALDGARSLGAKVLVAGGGRCNVTHDTVDESSYAGSSRHAIRNVLARFGVDRTIAFFREQGVELKREETGKLFPVSDRARTILDALLRAADDAGVEIWNPWRVHRVERDDGGFVIQEASGPSPMGDDGTHPAQALRAKRLILAPGGKSLPKSGSDGHGYAIARALGHSLTERVTPALVPLLLEKGHAITELSGLSAIVTLELRNAGARRLAAFTDSMLCTHFGISGPVALDISRYFLAEVPRAGTSSASLHANWFPGFTREAMDAALLEVARVHPSWTLARAVCSFSAPEGKSTPVPERLARTLVTLAGLDPSTPLHAITKEQRRSLVTALTELHLPITGDRGYTYAEVTAGGIPLAELNLKTMESRCCPGLYLCGEICDVDGRIGGYNFQWAWASGFVAGCAAGEAAMEVMQKN
jgi:predicted Rossmann fold flavoprotein